MATDEREIAHKTQEKFEFYVISLVFTLLALSIQTAKFGEFVIADSLELLGWLCLLISGIAGLWRLEYISIERLKKVQKDEFENKIFELRELQMKGVNEIFLLETNSNQAIPQRMESFRTALTVLGPVIEKLERSNFRKYKVHRYLFVASLACLLGSRSYGPLTQLARTVYGC
ncbi:MAG: hypothetical protein HY527_11435 [Betaproteobacteria bacterium]|nr:hypothetical protein [Betaproteobacteria bacterium]